MLRLCLTTLTLAAICIGASAQAVDALRTWTSSDGKTLQARLTRIQDANVHLQFANGTAAVVPLSRLSPADQEFVKQASASLPTTTAPRSRVWPETVEVPTRSIEVQLVEENAEQKNYVYRSEFFQFSAQDKLAGSVMKEIARTFEATHSLVNALPWGVNSKPPKDLGYYQAKFYVNRRNYIMDGGPENSGGVYMSRDRVFRVPFESLGLVMRGKTWFKDENYRNDTIVHEITHQMMHELLPFLPIWTIEGTAEYVELLPYNAGRFLAGSHQRGFRDYLKTFSEQRGITIADMGSAIDHMKLTTQQWHDKANSGPKEQGRLYFTSCVLVYYFSHLDGDGKGTRFLNYMDQITQARDAWAAFFSNPQVKRNPDGSYTFPSSLPRPSQARSETFGIEQLSVLLDGRDPDLLEADIKAGLKKLGIR